MHSEARWHSLSQFALRPNYSNIEVWDHSLQCVAPGCRDGLCFPLQFLFEYFPSFCELWLFSMGICYLIILVSFLQLLALVDAINNSLYSVCYILSNRNAILSTRISILLSILVLSTYLRRYFVCSNFLDTATTDSNLFISSTRMWTLCGQ